MSVIRSTVTTAAKQIAQDPGGGAALLQASGDYDLAIDQAIEHFRKDKPNLRIFHYSVLASAFRFVLFGTGAILPTSGLDRWVDGASRVDAAFQPYDTTTPDNVPIDENLWRVRREPGPLVLLELLATRPSSGILRLEYITPHTIDVADVNATSLQAGDVKAFEILTAAKICEAAARRYAQNTGTSQFASDQVDRRTQSDVMAKRAKELMDVYASLMGLSSGAGAGSSGVAAAATVRKLEIPTLHHRGRLWPRSS